MVTEEISFSSILIFYGIQIAANCLSIGVTFCRPVLVFTQTFTAPFLQSEFESHFQAHTGTQFGLHLGHIHSPFLSSSTVKGMYTAVYTVLCIGIVRYMIV